MGRAAADQPGDRGINVEGALGRGAVDPLALVQPGDDPVAAALANAIRDATGARLTATPFAPDRIYRAVADGAGGGRATEEQGAAERMEEGAWT